MYIIAVEVKSSSTHGKGVFAKENIQKGSIVWKSVKNHDNIVSTKDFDGLDEAKRKDLENTGYLSPSSDQWIFPPDKDPARYTNHSRKNNLTALYDPRISPEPYFIANRAISAGEELTNNYYEFDKITQNIKPGWA